MSGAEMTGIHRLPAGAEDRVRSLVRPALVIADPEAMTSAPEPELRASSMNALAHGADSLYTPFANPVSRMTALRGAELIATSLDEAPAERNRAALAQGSILCGYAIDSGAFSLHHVICQTLVRICGATHAGVNAAILPRAMSFMAPRAPDGLEPLATAIGTDSRSHRIPHPRTGRQPTRPGRSRRGPSQAPRSPGRDAAPPGAGFHAGAADARRAGSADRRRLVGRSGSPLRRLGSVPATQFAAVRPDGFPRKLSPSADTTNFAR